MREYEIKAFTLSELISLRGKYVREMQPYDCCHCPPEHNTEDRVKSEQRDGGTFSRNHPHPQRPWMALLTSKLSLTQVYQGMEAIDV